MIELWQFRASPYNEKVRWALDMKRVPHRRRSVLPGPHVGAIQSRSGQTSTPILRLDDQWISGSATIIAALETKFPDPSLFPEDPATREEALAIEKRFDEDFGPRMRRATFGQLLPSPLYLGRIFAAGRPGWAQWGYGAVIPLAAPVIRSANGITGRESIEDGERAIEEAFTFVEQRLARGPYLAGEDFSIADLTACAFLAMVCDFLGTAMEKPKPMPASIRHWSDQRALRPAAVWARGVYAKHRARAHDFDGASPPTT